ncbi:MAG TPA: flagellar hook basal-body protein [Allosphingosinicella sp.]|nr:flagellar hook basal-body protein [Allosphingosinicella sp.]
MNGVFHIGATGLQAQDRALHIVANNITNMNTPGFKRAEMRFAELIGPTQPIDGSVAATAAEGGIAAFGVSAAGAERVFLPGEMRPTGNPLDLAISGDGFIELTGPDGQTLLWRGGTLRITEDGFLAGANGFPLKAAISVPEGATSLTVDAAGEVRAIAPGETTATSIGRIDLVLVRNMAGLADMEGGVYRAGAETDIVTAEAGEQGGTFVQGSIELSNVALTDEMVQLMMMQRAYAASAQVVQAGDQLMAIANGLKR